MQQPQIDRVFKALNPVDQVIIDVRSGPHRVKYDQERKKYYRSQERLVWDKKFLFWLIF